MSTEVNSKKNLLTLTTNDGKTYTLTLGSAELVPEKLVKTSVTGYIYKPSYYDVEELNKSLDAMLKGDSAESETSSEN